MPKTKPTSPSYCGPFRKIDRNTLLPSNEIEIAIRFEETNFPELAVVYTNSGRQIAGQCICTLVYSYLGVQKTTIGVSSLSLEDSENGAFSYFEGRDLALTRASQRLSIRVYARLWEYFFFDDNLNGSQLDRDLDDEAYENSFLHLMYLMHRH